MLESKSISAPRPQTDLGISWSPKTLQNKNNNKKTGVYCNEIIIRNFVSRNHSHIAIGIPVKYRNVLLLCHAMRKLSSGICKQWKSRSACASSQSDQDLRCAIGFYRMYEWRANARMRFCVCAGWCESAHFAYARRQICAWRGPYNIVYLSIAFDYMTVSDLSVIANERFSIISQTYNYMTL